LSEFNDLVKRNKKKKRHWYHGLKNSWWKGMSENAARQKIIETNNVFGADNKVEIDSETDQNRTIAICSMIRNEERFGHLKRFYDCLKELEKYHKNLIYIFIEGDSYDDTYKSLKKWLNGDEDGNRNRNYVLKKLDKGHDRFQKNRDTKRTRYFAEVRNMLVDYILEIPDISLVFMVDASYGMKGDIIGDLEKTLRKDGADIAAPLNCTHKDHTGKFMFYDIFAYRKNGKEFTNRWPYHNEIEKELKSGKSVRIDSCGGAYLVKREVFDTGVRYKGDKDCEHVGFTKRARDKGFVIKLNPKVVVRKGGDVE
jgi:hypothetical protein